VGNKDMPIESFIEKQKYKLNNFGLNVKWHVNDDVLLSFDAHDAKNESLPDVAATDSGFTRVMLAGSNNCTVGPYCGGAFGQSISFNGGFPITAFSWFPTQEDASKDVDGTLNPAFGQANIGSETAQVGGQSQVSDLKEFKF